MKSEFWQTLLGTIRGLNNEGSSKRATAFGFFILSAILVITYASCYSYVVVTNNNTGIGQLVVNQFNVVFATVVMTLSTALGITYFDKKLDTKKEVEINKSNQNEG